MKKKVMFLTATLLLAANVFFFVKETTASSNTSGQKLFQTMAKCAGHNGKIVQACTTRVYSERCFEYYCIIND